MNPTATRKAGRPPKPEGERGKPIGLRLPPPLIDQINRIRGSKPWPEILQLFADKWEGKRVNRQSNAGS